MLPHSICQQAYRWHAGKILSVLMQNMRLTFVLPLLLMSAKYHPKNSITVKTNDNQKQDQINMEDEAIFPNRSPLRDF